MYGLVETVTLSLALVHPLFEYVSTVWDPCLRKDIDSLERIHSQLLVFNAQRGSRKTQQDSLLVTTGPTRPAVFKSSSANTIHHPYKYNTDACSSASRSSTRSESLRELVPAIAALKPVPNSSETRSLSTYKEHPRLQHKQPD